MLSYNFMKDIMAPKLAHNWERFGLAVKLTAAQLQEIRENNSTHSENHSRLFCDVVLLWSTKQPCPFTWSSLIRALQSDGLQEYQLASELMKEHYV